ncbi:hypothetical protein O181_132427 [Austropuccinia psidii MF-1]|uniref:Uncharacterized protein n=1 Tax=Austropuccinia psidii MF-1 TaxID=1389203 RepID=A0A9Q3L7A1_9BASI|nr:hypothetical protein [Austropuccinia psidii MF-1]
MKPQPQGHVMDNPYYQDDIKPDSMLVSKARSPSQYQDGDNMSYTEREALKQLPETSSLPKFSGTGNNCTWIWQKTMSFESDKYSVDKDTYEWCLRQSKRLKAIDPQMNTQMRNHKLLEQMPGELDHEVKFRCSHNCTLDDISNTLQEVSKRANIGKFTP